jgi:hypothetical protein
MPFHLKRRSDVTLGKVCEPNPCLNGGTCSPYGLDTYSCNCPFGFTGRNCENRTRGVLSDSREMLLYCALGDPCVPSPCQNNGRCRPNIASGTYACDCPTYFLGQNCEISKLRTVCPTFDFSTHFTPTLICCLILQKLLNRTRLLRQLSVSEWWNVSCGEQ